MVDLGRGIIPADRDREGSIPVVQYRYDPPTQASEKVCVWILFVWFNAIQQLFVAK